MKFYAVFVCTQMEAGGVQIRATSMCDSLNALGIPTCVIFLYKKRDSFAASNYHFVLLDHKPTGVIDYFRIIKRFYFTIFKMKPICVIGFAHYASPLSCIAGLLTGARRRIATQVNPPRTVPLPGRIMDIICGTLGIYTKNIAASHAVFHDFINYPSSYRKNLTVVRNGVKLLFSGLSQKAARSSFNLPETVPLLISCGRLAEQKNHLFLLNLVARLPNVHLAILGEGELRARLESVIVDLGLGKRVHLIGEVVPERVAEFLTCGDVFVFPSLYEAFGLAVAEAMIHGLPVITSDLPSLNEVVGQAGFRLKLDESLWVEKIHQLLTSSDIYKQTSEKCAAQGALFAYDAMLEGFRREITADA